MYFMVYWYYSKLHQLDVILSHSASRATAEYSSMAKTNKWLLIMRKTLMLLYYNARWMLLALFSIVVITACHSSGSDQTSPISSDDSPRVPLAEAVLDTPADCTQFKTYVTQSLVQNYTHIPQYPFYRCGSITENPKPINSGVTDGSAPPSNRPVTGDAGTDPTKGPDGVSQTNNQEQGVNESDRVKVSAKDGTLFIGHGSFLIISKAFPPQNMTKLNETDLGEQIISLFYDEANQRLVVMTRYREPVYILASQSPPVVDAPSTGIVAPAPNQPITYVSIFDVTDRTKPDLINKLSIEGYYKDSRRINNRLHLITRNYKNPLNVFSDPDFVKLKLEFDTAVNDIACADPATYDPTTVQNDPTVISAKNNLREKINEMVATVDVNAFLPTAKSGTATNQTTIPQYLQCTDIHFPGTASSLGMQVITSLDTDGRNVQAAAIVNNSWLTYVSQTHLYMAERSSFWWRDSANINQTAIHKFSISESKPKYLATGLIDGYIHNAFSMSEYEDVLRVASTQTDFENTDPSMGLWRPMVKNHLTLLQDDNAGNLKKLSEIRDLAVGETIRSARFLKERGFIVTFRNTDPLFTFDLSDPSNPVLEAELTIPGFSSYLHPYDNNHLLTIGREGGANGTGLGNDMQLQLIDVTDMSQPKVIKTYTPNLPQGYSWSSAQYDYHAFTYYADAKILAIPIQILPRSQTDTPFSGVIAFRVSVENGFEELGRVDHSDLAKQFYCIDNTVSAPLIDHCDSGYYAMWATPRRSVVMTSGSSVYLYTISDAGLKAGEITDLNTNLGSLLFPPQYYPWYVESLSASPNSTADRPTQPL